MTVYYEPGAYEATITAQQIGESKSGNVQVSLTILPTKILSSPPAGIEDPFQRTVFLTLTPLTIGTEQSPGWVLKLLRALGFTGNDFATLDPANDHYQSLTDQTVKALCKHDTYQDRTREKWSILTGSIVPGISAPAKPSAIMTLNTLLGQPPPSPQPPETKRTPKAKQKELALSSANEVPF